MSSELSRIFSNDQFGQVRVVIYKGEPWFVGMDVARALGYQYPSQAIQDHCKKANKISQVSDLANTPPVNLLIIPESDVYRLIMRSNLPTAEAFQDWVTEEVLPSIRAEGHYVPEPELEAPGVFDCMKCMHMVLASAYVGNQLTLALDKCCKRLTGLSALETAYVELVAPQKSQLLTPTEFGKLLVGAGEKPVSARQVNQILLQLGLQRKVLDKWEPTEAGVEYAVMLDTGKSHSDGTPIRQLKWTTDVIEKVRAAVTL